MRCDCLPTCLRKNQRNKNECSCCCFLIPILPILIFFPPIRQQTHNTHCVCVCVVFADGILYAHTRHLELKATDLGAHNSFLIPLFLLLQLPPKQTLKGKGPGAVGQGETWLSRSSGRHSILCSIAKVGASASRGDNDNDDDNDGANACKHLISLR